MFATFSGVALGKTQYLYCPISSAQLNGAGSLLQLSPESAQGGLDGSIHGSLRGAPGAPKASGSVNESMPF